MSPLFLLMPIILPILGGFGIFFLGFEEEKKRNIYAETIVVLTSVLVLIALFTVRHDPVQVYSFTNGFSVDFHLDGAGMLFAGMVAIMWPLVMLYAFDYVRGTDRQNLFFSFFVMTYGVTLGVCFASNLTTLYVFYEILTLVTLPLVSYYGDHESLYAGRKYAAYTIGGASLAFFTVVIGTVYGHGGDFIYGGSLLRPGTSTLMQAAFIFGFFGFGVKAAIFPLQEWLPTASAAPTPVTALLHAVAVVNSGVFAMVRMAWYIFPAEQMKGSYAQLICIYTASFTLLFAAAKAVKERHFKRRMAYSTVSNLSYMLFGVLLLTPAGLQAGLAHMLFHGIIKAALFMCAGAFMHVTGKSWIYEINGVGKRMPYTFAVYTLGALSLTGIPLFCGFVSKWLLITAGIADGTPSGVVGAVALIISAFLCAIYSLSVSVRAYFPYQGSDRFPDKSGGGSPMLMLIPMTVFAVANILFGIAPGPVIAFIGATAKGVI